jgi:hypothetical protein
MPDNRTFFRSLVLSVFFLVGVGGLPASALELDWSGQFRTELHLIHNYSLDNSDAGATFDAVRAAGDGYYVPGGGSVDANFQPLFLRLRPKLVVNDNIYIKSEWSLGDPLFGMFGDAVPYNVSGRFYDSTQSRGSTITANRFWAEFLSDIGTFYVGRAPLNWGLGVVWRSGDGVFDRYQSTGDMIRLVAKFGAFSFAPAFIKYSIGNSVGLGGGGVTDYSIAFKYDSPEEDFEGGVNFIKRIAGANQDPAAGHVGPQGVPAGMNYNVWDIYGRKRFGKLTVAAELPITNGSIGGDTLEYPSFGLATELNWKASDIWETIIKAGHATGQPNLGSGTIDKYKAFYFNPGYRLGMIMFNYQLANFAGPNTLNNFSTGAAALRSPYDNPIANAHYLYLSEHISLDKWTLRPALVFAQSAQSAKAGQFFFNTWQRKMVGPAVKDQDASLGWELDFGATFQWDDYFQFNLDTGIFSPGDFFKFSNTAVDNATSTVFAISVGVGVTF